MSDRTLQGLVLVSAVMLTGLLLAWWLDGDGVTTSPRLPGADGRPMPDSETPGAPAAMPQGRLIAGTMSAPAGFADCWPGFRGPGGDNAAPALASLVDSPDRDWRVAWTTPVGEGFAGPVVDRGRVYLLDYDAAAESDALRCLSLADGSELWRYAYPVKVKRNHGMSRTVPAVGKDVVVSLGPKGHVLCADALTGKRRWMIDLVSEWGATIPPWYAGQCPLIDGDQVILAPSGDVMMIAVDLATGETRWQVPNTTGWSMTHASITPVVIDGRRVYVYPASGGVVGVDAASGELLWTTDAWRVDIATVPSPVDIGSGRIFLTGGYNAGSLALQVAPAPDGGWRIDELTRLPASAFGSPQHTPILHDDHLYGVRQDGRLVCLTLAGEVRWTSGADRFGLGPQLRVGDQLLAMDDRGELSLVAASPAGFQVLHRQRVIEGHDTWGPMALADGRLLVRSLTEMACVVLSDEPE